MSPSASTLPPRQPVPAPAWEVLKLRMREQFGETIFKRWLEPLTLKHWGMEVMLTLPTRFMKDWVEMHYADKLKSLCRDADPAVEALQIIVEAVASEVSPLGGHIPGRGISTAEAPRLAATFSNVGEEQRVRAPALVTSLSTVNAEALEISSPLDPRVTFDSFVIGKPNELAFAAAKRVAEASSVTFNPLYLYGGVGLGKTHLMHAIAHHIRRTNPARRVMYLSAEKFMYQFVRALRFKDTMGFKEQFRAIDVLMIDDIQFISGKESTQEEFFHTFNTLTDQNRQVVISADRPPQELEKIDERLRSRLGWGLCADLQPATHELRLGILHTKAEAMKCAIPEKVLEFLATRITANVRELEGALNRIVAHSQLIGRAITMETAAELLTDLLRATSRRVTIEEIQKKVAEHFNVKLTDMHSPRRARAVARPRQVAMYLAKQLTTRSLPEIGRKFGGRDHTTVIHAVRKIEELRAADTSLSEDVELLKRLLQN